MKNVLLLAMSILGRADQENYYQYGSGEVFSGVSQLEPITRMLDLERRKEGERLDKIIILETAETLRIHEEVKMSAAAFYKERAGRFLDRSVEFVEIRIDEDDPAEGIAQAVGEILREHGRQRQNHDKMRLWIDTQGGFRDVVMVFNAIVSLLKEQEIEPEGIYSIRFKHGNTKENPCPIVDQTKKYDIFKFVSAMQEFMDYGKAGGFKKYYGEENSFVQTVAGIADAIQMCRPQKFEEAVRKFADYLGSDGYKKADPYLQIFVEVMQSDYGILLEQPDNTIEQIRWCVKKEFFQQAVTFYIERMPKYYFEMGWLKQDVDVNPTAGFGKDPYAEAFYTDMFHEMLADGKDERPAAENDALFQSILKAAIGREKVNNRESTVRYLRAKAERTGNDRIKGAIDSMIKELEKNYDAEGKRQVTQPEPACETTVQKYLRNRCDVQGKKKRDDLLYGVENSKSGGENPKKSYGKKIMAIEAAKKKNPALVKMMEYYVIMKILRNRINHASEELVTDDEREAIAFFASEGIETGIYVEQGQMKFDYRKIAELIMRGAALVPGE